MPNNVNWIEKFKISEALKSEFESAPQKETSFLVWCLENKHLNENDYLEWASNEFQLPVASEQFFANDESRTKWRATWTTARFLFQWNASLLPLDDSFGVLRIGCLEVPDIKPELKLDQPVAFVLAPLSGLQSFWNEAFPKVEPNTAAAVEPLPQAVEHDTEPTTPLPPMPQEFDANSLMASWGVVGDKVDEATEAPSETPEVIEEVALAPEGFAAPEGFSAADIPIPEIPMPKMASVKQEEVTATAPTIPSVPVLVETAAPKPTIVVAAKNPPIPPMAPATGKIVGEIIGMIDVRNAKEKLDQCSNLSEVAAVAFSKFSRYFDRHMILLIRGFELRPHVWAGYWNLRSTKPAAINLDLPSVFRIVSRTQIPYHGYTKPSPVNDLFFGEWNNGTAPAHITIVPIIDNGQLLGMLMGATDGTLDQKVALKDAERWIEEIAPHVNRTKSLTAPKAA